MHARELTVCRFEIMFRGCVEDAEESTKTGVGARMNMDLKLEICGGGLAFTRWTVIVNITFLQHENIYNMSFPRLYRCVLSLYHEGTQGLKSYDSSRSPTTVYPKIR